VKTKTREKRLEYNERSTERHLNTWFLPVCVAVFAILYIWTGYRGWLAFLSGTGGVWLLATLWVYFLQRGLSIERKVHLAWATVGDSVPEELKLINRSHLPALWVEIVDEAETLETPVRLVSDVESQATHRRQLVHLFNRRGFYTLGPTRLRTGDPFGIYGLTLWDWHSSNILITPPQLPLTQLKLASGGWTSDQQRRSGILEREISDAGLRNYLPGDSLRRIHWRATAHSDSLIVKQLEATASEDWWIFVDLDATVQAGKGQDSTLELSVVLAASLVARGLKEHRRVGLAMVGPKLVWLGPRSGPQHQWAMMKALATAEVGDHSLAELMSLKGIVQTATSIVITPTTHTSWIAAAARSRGSGLTAILVDPIEFGGTANQNLLVKTLSHIGVPFAHIPRVLLEQAYASLHRDDQTVSQKIESRKRYIQQEMATWQHMD
jgi:uncharacterized protein (DUF58 family)